MKNDNKNNIDIIKIIICTIGIIMFIIGINYKIPSREFSFYNLKKYVGGDAYNAIIEASIRGGEISGAKICKTMYISSGIITISLGL